MISELGRMAARYADELHPNTGDEPWLNSYFGFLAGFKAAYPGTTAEEITERKSDGETFLMYRNDRWETVVTLSSVDTVMATIPFGGYTDDIRSWGDYRFVGPLQPELLDG